MKTKFKCSMKVAFVCILSCALLLSLFPICNNKNSVSAHAESQNVTNYLEAKLYLTSVRADYEAIISQVNEIYQQIEQTTQLAFEAQRRLTESRLNIGDLARYEYTNSTQFSVIMTIICSESLEDLFKNMDYANSVMDFQYGLVKEQTQRKKEFDNMLNTLNSQTEKQNLYLSQASDKLKEAEGKVEAIKSTLSPEELAELEEEIEDIGGGIDPGGDVPSPEPAPEPEPGPAPDPGGPWSSGIASAYGGSSDPNTPNPGTTATGEVCDDWSCGVAIPMAWPNFRQYFHHTVQIKWNGMTVIAKINDCGGMGGGSRSLDLQPGVFKAFGFQTCQAWGLRQVDYLIM